MACQKKEEEANIALIKGNILSLTEHFSPGHLLIV